MRRFEYGDEEIEYLRTRDPRLAAAIDAIGHVDRAMDDDDLFISLIHNIVGQQISSAALTTVWARMQDMLGEVTPAAVNSRTAEELQSCGITFTKAGYIKGVADRISSGGFDLAAVERMDDTEAVQALSSLPGIGTWTAEMLLLFCLGRPDIVSFGDLGIQRGMRMVYHHRKVTREMFDRHRRRYSPYGSVASLYLWEVAHGGVPGFERDFAPKKKAASKKKSVTAQRKPTAKGKAASDQAPAATGAAHRADAEPPAIAIRTAENRDLVTVVKLYHDISDAMIGTPHDCLWRKNEHPTDAFIEQHVLSGEMLVAEDASGEIVGSVAIDSDLGHDYGTLPWRVDVPPQETLVVHILTVRPDLRGQGLSRRLLHACIDVARRQGMRSVRLDVTVNNAPARALYESEGFVYVGEGEQVIGNEGLTIRLAVMELLV